MSIEPHHRHPDPRTADPSAVGGWQPLDAVCEPGAYLCDWSGHLLRVTQESPFTGDQATVRMVAQEPLFVTKISDDPFVAKTKARIWAANRDLRVNF